MILSILHEAASHGPSALAAIFVSNENATMNNFSYLPCDMLLQYMSLLCICPSVSMSQVGVTETAKHKITQIMPHDS